MKSCHSIFHLMSCWLIVIFIQIPAFSSAQVYFETLPSTKSEGTINIYGRGSLSDKIPLSSIKGSPFWSDDWKPAILLGKNPQEKWNQRIKLNLFTNEIYYKNKDNEEQVVNEGIIQKIIFTDEKDISRQTAVFLNGIPSSRMGHEKINGFVQILNEGKYQLLKSIKESVVQEDSLFGTLQKYSFRKEISYYLAEPNTVLPVKKLSKISYLLFESQQTDPDHWITRNKIDLRKEADVVKYLTYLNANN